MATGEKMGIGFYINNCDSGDFHCGIYKDKTYQVVRTASPGTFHGVTSYLKVYLNDGVPPTMAAVGEAIDEAYLLIGQPLLDNQYHKDTVNGFVEILIEPGFAETAQAAKQELTFIVNAHKAHGRKLERIILR